MSVQMRGRIEEVEQLDESVSVRFVEDGNGVHRLVAWPLLHLLGETRQVLQAAVGKRVDVWVRPPDTLVGIAGVDTGLSLWGEP